MRIAVVGAGYAGLITAYKLASSGFDVDVYEEHSRVGYPKHCTGLVSTRTTELIGPVAEESVLARYKEILLRIEEVDARIRVRDGIVKLDRVKLEEALAESIEAAGGQLFLGTRVTSISRDGSLAIGATERNYDLVILAEGVKGRLRDQLGLANPLLTTIGVNVEAPNPGTVEDHVEIGFSSRLQGFSWRLSYNGVLLTGALSRNPRELREVTEGSKGEVYGGIVVHGPPHPRPLTGRVILVGDAAGHNKPLTGGGLYPSTLVATAITRALEKSSEADVLPGVFMKEHSRVYRLLRSQYRLARAYYNGVENAVRVLKAAAEAGVLDALDNKIGYDEHDRIVWLMMRRPIGVFRTLLKSRLAWARLLLSMLLPGSVE